MVTLPTNLYGNPATIISRAEEREIRNNKGCPACEHWADPPGFCTMGRVTGQAWRCDDWILNEEAC